MEELQRAGAVVDRRLPPADPPHQDQPPPRPDGRGQHLLPPAGQGGPQQEGGAPHLIVSSEKCLSVKVQQTVGVGQ